MTRSAIFVFHAITLYIVCLLPISATAFSIDNAFFSNVGGTLHKTSGPKTIPACDMKPYGALTTADKDGLYNKALGLQQSGSDYLDSMSLFDCEDGTCSDPNLTALLTDPGENYESLGFVDAFYNQGIEEDLRQAIDSFAYLLKCNYSGDALTPLGESIRQLLTIYMVFANEFLIDALDFRFSATTPNMDAYLDEQLGQLDKAIYYYQEGAQAFISMWLESIGWSDKIIGQYFGQEEWETFGLLYQRLASALREQGVRERVRLQKSDEQIIAELTDQITPLFIQTAAMSETLGSQFADYGGDQILSALNMLKKRLANIQEGRNPLGYDDQYVPLNSFEDLYSLALSLKTTCQTLESQVQQEQRDFDFDVDKIVEQQNTLYTTYSAQLSDLTGCPLPTDPDNQAQLDEFILCVESAGGDLYDCPIDLEPEAFEACVQSQDSGIGTLGAKYRQIKDADLSLKRARLRFENIGKRISHENERMDNQVEIWNDYIGQKKKTLDDYQDNLMGSYLVQEVKTKKKVKYKDDDDDYKTSKKKIVKTFRIQDDELDINITKEKSLLDATLNFQIKNAKDDTSIKNLLLEQADALIGIDAAVNNINIMIDAFDAAMQRKDNLLRMWKHNQDFYEKYWMQKLPAHRIIQSQKIVDLSNKFNELAHYGYLATKALEYKFMEVLQGIPLPGDVYLNQTDLFKCQTTADFEAYLQKLDQYNTLECPAGQFQQHDYKISIAYDILGLTADNLGDLDHDGYVDDSGRSVEAVRFEKFQEYVNAHIDPSGDLTFTFTNSVYDRVFTAYQKANLKIWQGPLPCAPSLNSQGLTASLFFKGSSGFIFPVLYLEQKGTHTLLRKSQELAEYYPIKVRALINANDTSPEPFTKDSFTPFIDIDPRFQNAPMGEWTPAFTNRSVAASEWGLTVRREPAEYGFENTPFHKLKDICLYLGSIGNNFD